MRVLFVTPRYFPHVGGVERHLFGLTKALLARGHHVMVLARGSNQPVAAESLQNVEIRWIPEGTRRLGVTSRMVGTLKAWLHVLEAVRTMSGPDVVHGHDFAFLFSYIPIALRFPRVPKYVTFHGIESDTVASWAVVGRRLSNSLADGSMGVGAFIEKWYGTRMTVITYGGTDGDFVPPSTLGRSKSLAYVGRLASDLPLMEYLAGLRQVAREGDAVSWILYGEGELHERIRAAATGSEVDVSLMGLTQRPEQIFPRHEIALAGGYLSILEAIQGGCFVIAFARSRLREDYYRTHPCMSHGLDVATTIEGLARSVRWAKNHETDRIKAVEEGQEILGGMTWDSLADQYEKLWRSRT